MDRGRSPNPGKATAQHIRQSTSAEPHAHPPPYTVEPDNGSGTPFDLHNISTTADTQFAGLNQHATSGAFGDTTLTQDYSQQAQAQYPFTDASAFTYPQSQSQQQQQQQNFAFDTSGASDNQFPSFDLPTNDGFDQTASLDPSVLSDFDGSSLGLLTPGTDFTNTTFDTMASTMQPLHATSPHLLNSGSPSPNASPRFQNGSFQQNITMGRPRGVSESLDPSSAMFPQGQGEWTGMGGYRSHKRTPSDNLSDISSNHSPYMPTVDNFDVQGHSSPLLNSSQDPAFNDGLGLQQFSLNENQQFNRSPGHSPGHSPHIMPQPQHALPPFTAENNFGLNANMNIFHNSQRNDIDMFPGTGQEPFPSLNTQGSSPGADHMSPPEINIDYAPPTRPVDNMGRAESSQDALSPPQRCELRPSLWTTFAMLIRLQYKIVLEQNQTHTQAQDLLRPHCVAGLPPYSHNQTVRISHLLTIPTAVQPPVPAHNRQREVAADL